jgi:hypothetical protein
MKVTNILARVFSIALIVLLLASFYFATQLKSKANILEKELTELKQTSDDISEERDRLLDLQKQLRKENTNLKEEVQILTDKKLSSGNTRIQNNTIYKFDNKLAVKLNNEIDSLKRNVELEKLRAISIIEDSENRIEELNTFIDSTLSTYIPTPHVSYYSDLFNEFKVITQPDTTLLEGTIKNDLEITHYTKKEKKRGRVTYVNVKNNNPFVVDEKVVAYKIERPRKKCFIFGLLFKNN